MGNFQNRTNITVWCIIICSLKLPGMPCNRKVDISQTTTSIFVHYCLILQQLRIGCISASKWIDKFKSINSAHQKTVGTGFSANRRLDRQAVSDLKGLSYLGLSPAGHQCAVTRNCRVSQLRRRMIPWKAAAPLVTVQLQLLPECLDVWRIFAAIHPRPPHPRRAAQNFCAIAEWQECADCMAIGIKWNLIDSQIIFI